MPTTTAAATGELETLLPDVVGGEPLAKTRVDLTSDYFKYALVDIAPTVAELSATLSDVTVVTGVLGRGTTPLDPPRLFVLAIRVAGADTEALLAEFLSVQEARLGAQGRRAVTLGGKDVTFYPRVDAPAQLPPEYVYAHDDVLFTIETRDATAAEEILAALP